MTSYRTSAGTIMLNGLAGYKHGFGKLGSQRAIQIIEDDTPNALEVEAQNMEVYSPQQTSVAAHTEQLFQQAEAAGVPAETIQYVAEAAIAMANQAIDQKGDYMASYQAVVDLVLPTLNQPLSVSLFQEPAAPIAPEQALQVVSQAQQAAIVASNTGQNANDAFNAVIDTVKESQKQPNPAPPANVAQDVKNDLVQNINQGGVAPPPSGAKLSTGGKVIIGVTVAAAITAAIVIARRKKKKAKAA